MTRREELEDLARDLGRVVLCSSDPEAHILDTLLQVERECWEKNERAARDTAFLMGNDKWRERNTLRDHADWCRQQKEGL